MAFGIDFGTTNTAVVECLTTGHATTKTVYGENNQPFPSLVALHPAKDPVFGWEVKKRRSQLIADGYHVVASFKSILGSSDCVKVGEKQYSDRYPPEWFAEKSTLLPGLAGSKKLFIMHLL